MILRTRKRHGGAKPGTLPRLVVLSVVLFGLLLSAPGSSSALTTTTISIDGSFSDWIGVRADMDNVAYDTQIPDDPDYPSQPDRDTYLVNATYDNEYLYLAWRRTAGGTKAITYGAYIDVDADGLLHNNDKVVLYTVSTGNPAASWNGGKSPTAWILRYNQARTSAGGSLLYPAGDPMGGDGDTPDGWAQWQDGYDVPAKELNARLDTSSGIECEARVAWSDLGLAPGSPIIIHYASGNGEAWGTRYKPSTTWKWIGSPPQYLEENRGQVEDNIGGVLRLIGRSVLVQPDRNGGAAAGTTVTYEHTITNSGNMADVFALAATSSQGWPVQIVDSSGTPITSLSLARGASQSVTVRVSVPAGTPDSTRDVTTLTATSTTDTEVTGQALDTTTAGLVSVTPDRSASASPGGYVIYAHTLTNNTGSAGTFDLTAASLLGLPLSILDFAGNPVSSVTLSHGDSTALAIRIDIPASTPYGVQDVTRLTAALRSDPTKRATATDITSVRTALDVAPDRSSYGGAGTYLSYRHTITNSWSVQQTVALTATSSRGWAVSIFDTDGVTPLSSVTLPAFGGSREVVVRVAIPAGTASGTQDTTVLRGTAGTLVDTATDVTSVRALSTYDTPGYANEMSSFIVGQTVYARGTGLSPRSDVVFVWKNPSGAVVRTSSVRTVDTQGMAFDDLPLGLGDPTGGWTVELQNTNGAVLEARPFTVGFRAEITALAATDAATVGSTVAVESSTRNDSAAAIVNSTMTYIIWWDTDGSSTFNVGDTYIDTSGAPQVWDGNASVASHITTGINVAAGGTWTEATPWTVSNERFPNQGMYRVTATWTTTAGAVIDTELGEFYSIPVLGWPLAALAIFGGAVFAWRRREQLQPSRVCDDDTIEGWWR